MPLLQSKPILCRRQTSNTRVFTFTGLCFMIGTFSALLPSVQSLRRPLSCGADGYSWWTAFPYLVSTDPPMIGIAKGLSA